MNERTTGVSRTYSSAAAIAVLASSVGQPLPRRTGGSLAADALDPQAQAVPTLAGGDDRRMPVLAAEADVFRARLVHLHVLHLLAVPVEHRHPLTRQVDGALVVQHRPVRSLRAE